ncbi:MAG: hypothetical protein ACO3YZ_04715 [Candidatus Nanopelagicaceae bacterium]
MARMICNVVTCVGVASILLGCVFVFDIPVFAEITCVQDPLSLQEVCE